MKERMNKLLENPSLTPRHREIITSMMTFEAARGHLTPGQLSFFESIERDYTKPEGWEFTEEMKETWAVITRYYRTTQYWQAECKKSENPDYVPAPHMYERMVNNKYAQRVLLNWKAPAKWKKGDLVLGRQTLTANTIHLEGDLPRRLARSEQAAIQNGKLLIVDVLEEPSQHKTYRVMCVAKPQLGILQIQERFLKNLKKS
jgi:hypothetical protein